LLVQPATVDRWHRRWVPSTLVPPLAASWKTMHRFIMSRSDSALAGGESSLGAPRIHGELVKLGIVVSERTVSRYLRIRPSGPSQTWRTFLANHLPDLPFILPAMSSSAPADHVVDVSAVGVSPL
jgi:hypothetical protein